jgi:hypothetical protein
MDKLPLSSVTLHPMNRRQAGMLALQLLISALWPLTSGFAYSPPATYTPSPYPIATPAGGLASSIDTSSPLASQCPNDDRTCLLGKSQVLFFEDWENHTGDGTGAAAYTTSMTAAQLAATADPTATPSKVKWGTVASGVGTSSIVNTSSVDALGGNNVFAGSQALQLTVPGGASADTDATWEKNFAKYDPAKGTQCYNLTNYPTIFTRVYEKFEPDYWVTVPNHQPMTIRGGNWGIGSQSIPLSNGSEWFTVTAQSSSGTRTDPIGWPTGALPSGYVHPAAFKDFPGTFDNTKPAGQKVTGPSPHMTFMYIYGPGRSQDHAFADGFVLGSASCSASPTPNPQHICGGAFTFTGPDYPAYVKRGDWIPNRGQWYCIEQMVKLNTIVGATGGIGGTPRYDGEIAVWVDGVEMLHFYGLFLRGPSSFSNGAGWVGSTPNLGVAGDGSGESGSAYGINRVQLWLQRNGSTTSTNPITMWDDNFVIATSYIGPKVTSGNVVPSFTTPSSINATVGAPFNFSVNTAGTPNPTVTRTGGTFPPGISGSGSSNQYTFTAGPPTTAGDYVQNMSATNSAGTTTQNVTIHVSAVTCTLTAPPSGIQVGSAPLTINLAANAAAGSGGSITHVDFYNGANLIGTDTTAPYTFVWTPVAAGSYSLTAKAYNDSGGSAVSAPVSITVVAGSSAPQPPANIIVGP